MSEIDRLLRPQCMEAILTQAPVSTRLTTAGRWTARVLGAVLTLFLFVDGAGKILRLAPYVEGTARVGYPDACLVPLGVVLVVSTLLYVVPRTSVLGAILLTGYLGGATATHVRMGQPFVFPVIFGVLLWACLYAREERLQAILPLARRPR